MKNNLRSLLVLTLISVTALLLSCAQPQQKEADLVLHNGVIYTVDNNFSVVEAIAILNDKIVATGSDADLKVYIDSAKEKIDLGGKAVYPGLIDAHAHITGYAQNLDKIDFMDTTSAEQIAAMVAEKAKTLKPGEWITGRGWDQNDWPIKEFPTYQILSEAAPDNPVVLTRVDGHANWANAKAMEIAGVDKSTADPSGGEIIRDNNGNPTGVFIDNAETLITRHVPDMAPERTRELLKKAIANCNAAGLTGVHDMGGGPANVEMMKSLIDEDAFPFRVFFNYSTGLKNLDQILAAGIINHGDYKLVAGSIKAFCDGALGSRGAAMLEPYSDRPDSTGLIVDDEDRLAEFATKALENGFQMSVHAIGDKANRMTLNAYERAIKATGKTGARLRIEHSQILAPEDIPRFKELEVLPSMQPTHCTSDMPWAIDRVGEERAKGAYAWRSLLETGVIIPCGSDFPVEKIEPLRGFYSAVTRKHEDGQPENGYFPDQVMTRQEALKGFTIWAAYSGFMENVVGSLEVGKKADLIIMDRDIMKVPEEKILGSVVLKTFVDGKLVYSKEN